MPYEDRSKLPTLVIIDLCMRLLLGSRSRHALVCYLVVACSASAAADIESTAFPNEPYVAMAFASVDSLCNQFVASVSIVSQGANGLANTATVDAPYDPQCPMVFPWSVVRYTWTTAVGAQDSIPIDISFPNSNPPSPTSRNYLIPKKASLVVRSVDWKGGYVLIDFGGSVRDTIATATLEFTRSDGYVIRQSPGAYIRPGAGAKIPIDRPPIPKGYYSKLKVILNTQTLYALSQQPVVHQLVAQYSPSSPWYVLGIIKYTQYNTPTESACSGGGGSYYIVDSLATCNFSVRTLSAAFASQVALNGTGRSNNFGLIQTGAATRMEAACAGRFPPGATASTSFLQVNSVVGACLVPLVEDVSVASYESSARSNCGMTMTLVDRVTKGTFQANRRRDDQCPACINFPSGTDGHIDAYSGSAACTGHGVGDLGTYWTVRTN